MEKEKLQKDYTDRNIKKTEYRIDDKRKKTCKIILWQ